MPISTPGRNLKLCFTKIKWPLAPQSPPMSPTLQNPSDHDHTHIRNFNSLYDSTSKSFTHSSSSSSLSTTTSTSCEPDPTAIPADFATAFASQRFFFSTPGRSNSIIESTVEESALAAVPINVAVLPEPEEEKKPFRNSVAVPTYSPDPYADFRRSMQEMVEAREPLDVNSNWDFLHELLLCYLALNPKNTHKFIVGAFADLLVSLLSQPPAEGRRRDPKNCEISQR
ncbi:transcription repressor OFP16-like [Corylus avellana]|uniref:transcription repressor OFP16-like n=1 Tax=Corylus avellana TaxID=13451 RepID=UPI001E209C6E|nr:transcription repressor OFP16-like [Corylus avellana]XP_059439547.1 transcription repressor OFP16-like [Corylus avellana]